MFIEHIHHIMRRELEGMKITDVERRGKYLLLKAANRTLILHLGMSFINQNVRKLLLRIVMNQYFRSPDSTNCNTRSDIVGGVFSKSFEKNSCRTPKQIYGVIQRIFFVDISPQCFFDWTR